MKENSKWDYGTEAQALVLLGGKLRLREHFFCRESGRLVWVRGGARYNINGVETEFSGLEKLRPLVVLSFILYLALSENLGSHLLTPFILYLSPPTDDQVTSGYV